MSRIEHENKAHRLGGGFTLIELLVVLAVLAVLATLAAPSMRQFAANQALAGFTRELLGASMTARSAAISRNKRIVMEPIDATEGWVSGWRVYVDDNRNGTLDAGEEELAVGDVAPGTVAMNSDMTNCSLKSKFGFRPDGFLQFGGTYTNGGIPLQSTVTSRTRCVVFQKSGRTRICGNDTDAC